MLEAKALQFDIDGKSLLKAFDLTFETGKTYALVGHNGSGKSTLLKLLAQQQPYSDGDILLHGDNINRLSAKKFAQHIAYLPQHLPMTDSILGRDLVSFGRYPWHGLLGRLSTKDKTIVEEAMEMTGSLLLAEMTRFMADWAMIHSTAGLVTINCTAALVMIHSSTRAVEPNSLMAAMELTLTKRLQLKLGAH